MLGSESPLSCLPLCHDKESILTKTERERHSHKLRKPEQELLLIKHEINIKLYFILIIIVDNIPAVANLMSVQDSHSHNVLFTIPTTNFSIDIDKTVFSE